MAMESLVSQATSALYNYCKASLMHLTCPTQDIEDLEGRINALKTDLISIMSRKEEMDRLLGTSVPIKKIKEYVVMETNVAAIYKNYAKFINKYARMPDNFPSLPVEEDKSTAALMIDRLEEIQPKRLRFGFLKLAKLSRDIAKLRTHTCRILDRLVPEYMIYIKSEPDQEKLNDDNDLPVFNTYVNEVLDYLSEKGNKVGISGPAGVGKTIVLRKLYNQLIETKALSSADSSTRLDNIIWTEYPPRWWTEEEIVKNLQNEIMVQLKINHKSTDSIYENANTVSTFLRQRKYVLLMDQVRNYIDLNKLGLREDHKYKNVVIASRDKKFINLMIEHEVKIQRLSKNDAWKLFENNCGKIYHSRERAIADRIIEYCGGIPWMINSVARHLRNKKDESLWNDVKRILQSDSKSSNLLGFGEIDSWYEKIYKNLERRSKKCLLYVALFPNEHRIHKDYLIECWIAEGFMIENDVQKVRLNRERGKTILNHLIDLYLLEWCSDKEYIKMPPNIRRVALGQNYPGEEKCVTWVPLNGQKPNEETWRIVTRMSLIGCKTKLPESPQCHNIYTLQMQFKPELKRLEDLFFYDMQSLRVLDLSHTEIGALPSSIGRLVNLRSLYLNSCHHLAMLPPEAAKLVKLEFLDICGTSIPSLPLEIRYMIDLRCLRASFSPRGHNHNSIGKEVENPEAIIPLNIICNLTKLEELSINTCLHCQPMADIADNLAMELASLEYLTTLHFNFPNVSSFNRFVTHSKSMKNIETSWGPHTFRSFKIFVGCYNTLHPYESDVSGMLAERRLGFSTNEGFSSDCKKVLMQASAFELIGNGSVETLSQFDLHSLKVCVVERCNCLENIVDGHMINGTEGIVEEISSGVLQNLVKLHLYDLKSLQCIWEGPILPQSLVNLTVLTLNGCPKLRKILDPPLARTLLSLKYLKVEYCREVSNIVETPEGSSNLEQVDLSDILKSVEIVELSNLPQLQSICKSTSINWNSLNSIMIIGCRKLNNLSLTKSNAKKLASIECEESWWTPLQLPDGVKAHLLPFCRFEEKTYVLEAQPKGETLTIGRSVFIQASYADPVLAHTGDNIAEQIGSSNGKSIGHPASNIKAGNGSESPEKEILIHDDIQASSIFAGDSSRPVDKTLSTSESTRSAEILIEASSDVHNAVISAISPADPNSASISEDQFQQQFADENAEEDMAQEGSKTEMSRSPTEQENGRCTLNKSMQFYIGDFGSRQAVESVSYGEIQVEHEIATLTDAENFSSVQRDIASSSYVTGRSQHHEESIPSPNTTDFVPEKEHYLVFVEDNLIKLKLDHQTILIGDCPSSAPPESFPVNAELNLEEQDSYELLEKPDHSNYLLLLLQRNKCLSLIRSSFLDTIRDLCLLDLSYTRIRFLPSSLFWLSKVKVLMLRNCVCLGEIPSDIGKLKKMEVLDLSGSELYNLPDAIGQLTLLKHMQLSFYGPDDESEYAHLPSQLVSPSFLSELKELKTLSITVHPNDRRWMEIAALIIQDVGRLDLLSYLQFYFPEVKMLEDFILRSPSRKLWELSKCKFIVGHDVKRIISRVPDKVESLFDQQDRCLRFVNGEKVHQVIKIVLLQCTAFYLDRHIKIQSLSEFGISNFQALKFCVVRECPKFQAILDNKTTQGAFPCLERLGLYYLWELKHIWKPPAPLGRLKQIWKRPVPSGNFEALKHLTVNTCPKLQFILCESMLQCLSNLEKLVIIDCERVEKVIKEENEKVNHDIHVMLPRLKKLVLHYLPKLVSLGNGLCLSEEKISIYGCPKLILSSQPGSRGSF